MSMFEPYHVVRPRKPQGKVVRALYITLQGILLVPLALYAIILLPIAIVRDKSFLRRVERSRRRVVMKEARRIERREVLGVEPW